MWSSPMQDCIDRGFFVKTLKEVSSGQQPGLWAILTTAWEVAGAMSYLHSLDLMHGDLIGGWLCSCPAMLRALCPFHGLWQGRR